MLDNPEVLILIHGYPARSNRGLYLYVPPVTPAERFISARYVLQTSDATKDNEPFIESLLDRARSRIRLSGEESHKKIKEDGLVF